MLPARGKTEGLTLIEVTIAIAVIALMATGATIAFRSVNRSELRSGCAKVISAVRYSFSRAVTRGTTVRVLLDLDAHTVALQEAHGAVALRRAEEAADDDSSEDAAAVDPWEAAKGRLESTLRPTTASSPFSVLTGREGHALERAQPHPIGRGVRILRLITPHESQPRDDGKGAIYFFRNGIAEDAVVWLSDRGEEDTYSIVVHGLTGRAELVTRAVETASLADSDLYDEDLSDVADPG